LRKGDCLNLVCIFEEGEEDCSLTDKQKSVKPGESEVTPRAHGMIQGSKALFVAYKYYYSAQTLLPLS
jgi:hypothetical protein